jgi:dephospho-CoA kinase
MLNVGLTGNVAAGKSTVLALFANWGATIIDADELVREVQAPGSPVLAAIESHFGRAMILADGTLDRAGLRRSVAGNAEALAVLNSIVHPAVQRLRGEIQTDAAQRGDCIVVNDIPLLFEVLDPDAFDVVVLVDAPEDVRRERLMRDRRLPEDEAVQLIASQMPAAEKRRRSRFVIDNDVTLDALERSAWDVWCAIRRDAAARRWSGTGPLLVMFAHPDDESFAIGGTLARYADAGAEVHVWCATRGDGGTLRGERVPQERLRAVRTEELRNAAAILGVQEVHQEDFPDGALQGYGSTGHRAAADILRRIQPEVVVTFGPDGVTGHDDHKAVHRWVTGAVQDAAAPGALYYVTYPTRVSEATSGRIAGRPDDQIVARLDVRPWRTMKVASIEAHASQRFPLPLDTPPGSDMMAREWYAGTGEARGVVFDLYETPKPA